MMNASGARENACTRGVVYTLVDFTLTKQKQLEAEVITLRQEIKVQER
jgi:hypothetical protein